MSSSPTLLSLPDELIVAIATATLALPLGRRNQREPPFPVLLSHVCARLRALILRAPLLWTTPRLREGLQRHTPVQMGVFLERSAPCMVDLALDFRGLPPGAHDALVYTACASAAAHAARWDRLVLAEEWGACLPVALAALRDVRAPRLRVLELTIGSFPWGSTVPFTACLPGGAPNLRVLTLKDVPLPWSSLAAFPRLAALTVFSSSIGHEPTFADLRGLFAALPELSDLVLRAHSGPICDENEDDADDEPMLLPALTTLELSFARKDSASHLLARLRLPVLRALTLGNAVHNDLTRLSAGGLPLLPLLTHLNVTNHAHECADFGFVRELPALRSVLLVGRARTFLEVLAGPRCPCPRLRKLALSWVEPADLKATLAARAAAGHPVEDVKLLGGPRGGVGDGMRAWCSEAKAELAADMVKDE